MWWRSVLGLLAMLVCAWLLGGCKRVPWRCVIVGIALQFAIAFLALRTSIGLGGIEWFRVLTDNILGCVEAGCSFVFGEGYKEHFFAFRVLPTIIFMGALMSVLYHYGVLQRVVAVVGWVMQRTMGTSGAESLCAASNIFVGQTEAPLVIKPYLAKMTNSEINAVMIGGFATIAGGVMAAFIGMGIDAGHLLTASVISAPAALVVAKLILPETETPATLDPRHAQVPIETTNGLDALSRGASDGLQLGLNIAAMIIAFLAVVKLLDISIEALGAACGQPGITLTVLLGYANAPFAWLMGVASGDEYRVGQLLGLKLVTNEFVAYELLHQWKKDGSEIVLAARSEMIAVFALCGFANLSSIGIQIGGLGAMMPERRADLARLGLKAMLGGNLACYMTACIAGIIAR